MYYVCSMCSSTSIQFILYTTTNVIILFWCTNLLLRSISISILVCMYVCICSGLVCELYKNWEIKIFRCVCETLLRRFQVKDYVRIPVRRVLQNVALCDPLNFIFGVKLQETCHINLLYTSILSSDIRILELNMEQVEEKSLFSFPRLLTNVIFSIACVNICLEQRAAAL